MNLWFGDSNTKKLFGNGSLQRYPGLMLHEPLFEFYLCSSNLQLYKNIYCFIGTNDLGNGYQSSELIKSYTTLLKKYPNITIIGPYAEEVDPLIGNHRVIDTVDMPKSDGIHLNEWSYQEIGYRLMEM